MKKATTTILLSLATCMGLHAAPDKAPKSVQSPADIIAMFDTDGDGLLSEAELGAMMEARRKQMQQGRRSVSDDQAKKMRNAKAAWSVGEAAVKAAKKAMIENFDRNGDGILDKEEQAAMEQGAKDAMEWGKKMMIRKFDADGDGQLNGPERAKAMKALKTMIVGDIMKIDSEAKKKCCKADRSCKAGQCKAGSKKECKKSSCDKKASHKKGCDKGACAKKECGKKECKTKAGSKKDEDKKAHRKDHDASKSKKTHRSRGSSPSRERIMKQFDTDGDGKLNETEKAALKAAMKKRWESRRTQAPKDEAKADENKKAPQDRRAEMMKKFSTDGDGQLSDAEKEAIRIAVGEMMNRLKASQVN